MTDDLIKKDDTPAQQPTSEGNGSTTPPAEETPVAETPAAAPLVDDATAEKRRKMRERMMQDAPGDAPAATDTIESLHKEKVLLLQQLATAQAQNQQLTLDLRRVNDENETLKAQLARAQEVLKESIGKAEEKSKQAVDRVTRQAQEDNKLAVTKFVKAQMPVIDDIEVVMGAITPEVRAKDKEIDAIAKGVEMTMKKLMNVFNNFGVKQINPVNEEFDEGKGHEAIGLDEKVQGLAPGTVVKVAQKGYEVNGEVVRTAKVVTTPLA
jgi:molecular chaperone GrpE